MNQQELFRQAVELCSRKRGLLTDLQKDIVDTYSKLTSKPFDRNGAITQIGINNVKHNGMYDAIVAISGHNIAPLSRLPNEVLCMNLSVQLSFLLVKETESKSEKQ